MQAAQETVQQVAESSKEAANTGKSPICQPELKKILLEKPGENTVADKKKKMNKRCFECEHCIYWSLIISFSLIYGCTLGPEITSKTWL